MRARLLVALALVVAHSPPQRFFSPGAAPVRRPDPASSAARGSKAVTRYGAVEGALASGFATPSDTTWSEFARCRGVHRGRITMLEEIFAAGLHDVRECFP